MSHAQDAVEIQALDDFGEVPRELRPPIGRRRTAAATVPPNIHGKHAPIRKRSYDAVPAATVKSGGVDEDDGRTVTFPLPRGDGHIGDVNLSEQRLLSAHAFT